MTTELEASRQWLGAFCAEPVQRAATATAEVHASRVLQIAGGTPHLFFLGVDIMPADFAGCVCNRILTPCGRKHPV